MDDTQIFVMEANPFPIEVAAFFFSDRSIFEADPH